MLSFTPTEEQKMLVDAIARYAVNDVRAIAHDADEDSELPLATLQKGWELGLLPASIPKAYGGFGEHSAVTNAMAAEELAYGDLALAMAVMTPALLAFPVHFSGTEEQKQNILPQLSEATPPAFTAALMEPGIRFDTGRLGTTAKREGDHYVLNGKKCYVPMGKEARLILVYAQDAETGATDGYLIESSAEGLSVGPREKLMGVRALQTYSLDLNGVKVGAGCKLGGEQGSRYQRILSHSRVAQAAMAVGVARAAFDYARNYAKERVAFGVPIAQKQAIAFMLAEMSIEVDAARLMVWEAAWKLDSDAQSDGTQESYLAKQYADKAAMFVADSAVQTLGGHGYIREHPVERWLRNARGFAVFEGLSIV